MQPLFIAVPLRMSQEFNFIPIDGVFSYNKKGRFPWLQCICFAVLSRLNCLYGFERAMTKIEQFTTESLVDIILESDAVMQEIYHRRAKYVIVGREQMERLIPETDFMQHFMFEFPHQYMTRKTYPTNAFSGIRVVFVPWMDGLLVLPELP